MANALAAAPDRGERANSDDGDGSPDPARTGGATAPRLRHLPALDGLRGVAVVVVVVFHLGHLQGGFLGVDLFFVLSGFLITSLLLVEHAGSGAVRLGRFWARRARRLLPALLLMMAGVAVLVGRLTPPGERPLLRSEALATLGYVANWQAMGDAAGYWDLFVQPSPLDHMWSLAIEEQFYVVWPLVVAALFALAAWRAARVRHRARGTRLVAAVSGVGALASFTILALTYSELDTNRAYFGTDARLGPTLLGVGLAAVMAGRLRPEADGDGVRSAPGATADRAATAARAMVAAAAVAVIVWCLVAVDGQGSAYYRGGLVAFALASVVLVHLVVSDDRGLVTRTLAVRPLVALGVISYGVYLWHWPVIVYATPARTGLDGLALDAARVATTLALATVSYVVVERPIRRGWPRGWRAPVGLAATAGAVAVAIVVVTSGVARVPGTELALGEAATPDSGSLYPETIPDGAARVLLVGDSGPLYLGPQLLDEAERAGAAAASESFATCTIVSPEGVTRWRDGTVTNGKPCHDLRRQRWTAAVERFDPDVVVYYLAASPSGSEVRLQGDWVTECDDAYERWLRDALRDDADVLGARGATIVLATTPSAPVYVMDGQPATDALACRRATYDSVAGDRPGTQVVDMAAAVADAQRRHGSATFRDPIHLSPVGARDVARWLVPAVLPVARTSN